MKKMKLAAIFAGLVSVFTFSSCLKQNNLITIKPKILHDTYTLIFADKINFHS